jgi:GxxExxY protein
MSENELARVVFNCGLKVHRELGPGLLESVYEECLYHELKQLNLNVKRQKEIPIYYKNVKLESGFRADIVINDKLLLELKSVESVSSVHLAQIITYLKMSKIKLGLLINFNEMLFKNGIQRVINGKLP